MTVYRHFVTILPALIATFLLSLPASPSTAAEISPGLHAALQHASPEQPLPIILILEAPEEVPDFVRQRGGKARASLARDLRARARAREAPVEAFLHRRGITQVQSLWLIDGLALRATPTQIAELQTLIEVRALHLDEPAEPPPVEASFAHFSPRWNITRVGAPQLWEQGYAGAGQVVAVIDTGVDLAHPLLGPRWRGGSNSWFDPFDGTSEPDDFAEGQGVAHGTAVTGVVVAGEGVGVAPAAQWIAARIFHPERATRSSHIISALQWTLDPDGDPVTDDAPAVVNGSWGINAQNSCNTVYRPAIQALKAAGIAVVFAAGNAGPQAATSESPANYAESYAVGATDSLNRIAGFSSRGPSACGGGIYPDVTAPGVSIVSTDLEGGFASVSGTSFAAPHVAGVMLLLRQAFPTAPVAEIEQALRAAAVDLGLSGPDNSFGHGLIDAPAAYDYLDFTPVPELLAPETDALVDAGEVTLAWRQKPDSFGAPVENRVLVALDADFAQPLEWVAATSAPGPERPTAAAGAAGAVLLAAGLAAAGGRRRLAMRVVPAILVAALLFACGGGGGGSDQDGNLGLVVVIEDGEAEQGGDENAEFFPTDDPQVRTLTLTGLTSGATYYWKVVAENARGSQRESEVRSFTLD
ncbi:S8 family serine peptidase [Geoalkalibacter halelectricus]|uniref:S8 family serine peptidase n=1 Tax=Geoalkalibacter halelectricus TaxID=2847045 RepID=A0ABY5ZL16_9BACT|nr:S8 family serine peptidase [Geoalkalibacter halelectricus]MDO3377802.1 S8 family serine peptidase [Geoalkalibacter halelectricus]UWZ78605.1 S8 family serine peptidase [Geoalkalibacter halelectricus]